MTFQVHADYATVERILREVVRERGEGYVYALHLMQGGISDCRYEYGGCVDCGVGVVLYRLGAPLALLRLWDTDGGLDPINGRQGDASADLTAAEVLHPDSPDRDKSIKLLHEFQKEQDAEMRYGLALTTALDKVKS
jgi:hypothetical protein